LVYAIQYSCLRRLLGIISQDSSLGCASGTHALSGMIGWRSP
jgi:hypothetical protein